MARYWLQLLKDLADSFVLICLFKLELEVWGPDKYSHKSKPSWIILSSYNMLCLVSIFQRKHLRWRSTSRTTAAYGGKELNDPNLLKIASVVKCHEFRFLIVSIVIDEGRLHRKFRVKSVVFFFCQTSFETLLKQKYCQGNNAMLSCSHWKKVYETECVISVTQSPHYHLRQMTERRILENWEQIDWAVGTAKWRETMAQCRQ